MSKLSRRTLVTSAAALPAIVVLPVAASAAGNPDAKLLQLGKQFEQVEQEWAAQVTIDRRQHAIFEAKVEQATGIAFRDAPAEPDNFRYGDPVPELTEETRAAWYHATRERISKQQFGGPEYSDENEPWGPIHDRLYELVNEILPCKAVTAAGLAVQVRAVVLAAADLWDGDDNDDDNTKHEKLFIEAACAFVGVTPAPFLAAQARGAVQS